MSIPHSITFITVKNKSAVLERGTLSHIGEDLKYNVCYQVGLMFPLDMSVIKMSNYSVEII